MAFIPGNTFNSSFVFGPLSNAAITDLQAGGNLQLVLNGAPGWDGTFDGFGISYDVVPEPSSLLLLAIGLTGTSAWRRRQRHVP